MFVPLHSLVAKVISSVSWLSDIIVHPISETDRTDRVWGMYERIGGPDPYLRVPQDTVYLFHGAWQNTCYKRFVLCKEMQHVFDHVSKRTSTHRGYELLKEEIEDNQDVLTRPPSESAAFESEIDAQWKALLLLCPKPQRDSIIRDGLDVSTIRIRYRIPDVIVSNLLGSGYNDAYEEYVKDKQP